LKVRSCARRILLFFCRFSLLLTGLAFLAGRFGNLDWRLNLLSHFVVYYFLAFLVLAGLLARLRAWKWTGAAAVLALAAGVMIAPWYFPDFRPAAGGRRIRLLTANLLFTNPDPAPLIALIQREDPDVIFLQEVNHGCGRIEEALKNRYPHRYYRPSPCDNYGIAQLHRLDEVAMQRFFFGDNGPMSLLTHVRVDGNWLILLNIHGVPPASRRDASKRWAQMYNIAALGARRSAPLIVGGDLNITMWSPEYTQVRRKGELRNARRGHGILATWPVRKWDWFGPLNWWPLSQIPTRIPLEHVLVSPEIGVADCRRGPDIGSDHFPLIVDLVMPGT
jgi:endonuclease/exonuclease/phosphatase (EEP) superfamily protein YafD